MRMTMMMAVVVVVERIRSSRMMKTVLPQVPTVMESNLLITSNSSSHDSASKT